MSSLEHFDQHKQTARDGAPPELQDQPEAVVVKFEEAEEAAQFAKQRALSKRFHELEAKYAALAKSPEIFDKEELSEKAQPLLDELTQIFIELQKCGGLLEKDTLERLDAQDASPAKRAA